MYVYEFEFFPSNGYIDAVPCGDWGEGTFGDDLADAVESAADWLRGTVDDHLMGCGDLPPSEFGHEPVHSGQIIAVAVSRELGDIPAMTAADAARALGVSPARVLQLIADGALDSWRDGSRRMVSKASVGARIEYAPAPGHPTLSAGVQGHT